RFEGKYHARLEFVRMVERNKSADHRLLPDCQADSVAILQGKSVFFIAEAKFLRLRPYRCDFGGRTSRPNQGNSCVKIFAAALVRIAHGVRRVANCETAVITSSVTHVRMQDVVVDGVARAQHAI